MIKLLFTSATSACFELDNKLPYYAEGEYAIYLDDEKLRTQDSNVISLFGLERNREYVLRLEGEKVKDEIRFKTENESCALNVRDFGAKGDGVTDDTTAIQCAINALPENARLFFPEGRYLSLPLSLKSHITLEFSKDAVLLGSTEREKYPIYPGTVKDVVSGEDVHIGGFEGEARPMYLSLLTAQYAKDITIIGEGTIDGNAQNSDFWTKFKEFGTARPRIMFFNRCEDVTVHGVHACNSPSWQLHPYYCKNVAFYDVSVSAPKISPNTDAIDPESCDNVDIIGCHFTVGDDCIAIKSGKIDLGLSLNVPASRHTIRNCLMEFGHGAIVLGSEIGAGVKDLSVSQCFFRGTDRGLRIKSRRGRGKNCVIDNVSFDNIRMQGVLTPIAINLWYNCVDPDRESEYVWSREKLPVDDRTPHMGHFTFKNMECTDAEVAACYIDGLPEAPVDEVVLENIRIGFAEDAKPGVPIMENFAKERCKLGLYFDNVRHIAIRDVELSGVEGERVIADHYEKLDDDQ